MTAHTLPPSRAAIFFDRDGTLNEEVGYAGTVDRFHIYPFAAPAVRLVNQAGLPAILITNQAGVARGYFPESRVGELYQVLQHHLAAHGAHLDAMYYCPHHPEAGLGDYLRACECRKPRPGMLLQAARDFHLDLSASALVSDRLTDIAMARQLGMRAALVLTGYGDRDRHCLEASTAPDLIAADAFDAVRRILHDRLVPLPVAPPAGQETPS